MLIGAWPAKLIGAVGEGTHQGQAGPHGRRVWRTSEVTALRSAHQKSQLEGGGAVQQTVFYEAVRASAQDPGYQRMTATVSTGMCAITRLHGRERLGPRHLANTGDRARLPVTK